MSGEQGHQNSTQRVFHFGDCRLDLENEQLWQGEQPLRLTGKAFAVLAFLVSHAGQLVSKDELFESVWPDTVVSDATLTSAIKELRKALGDKAQAPQYIETAHRRGFRFIAPMNGATDKPRQEQAQSQTTPNIAQGEIKDAPLGSPTAVHPPLATVVGRDAELDQLHRWLDTARAGERQIVFVTGEPGIGKTTLLETFLRQINIPERVQIGRGQCIEQHGAGEAYMPVLEALSRLCREAGSEQVTEILRQYAPMWLIQLPALLGETERQQLQRQVQGAARERMLREISEALEALTEDDVLLLILEDLHWSDVSTLELLSALAQRRERARLMILATYRPVEVSAPEHPLQKIKQELQLRNLCHELAVSLLTDNTIHQYLSERFRDNALPTGLGSLLYAHTEGNPLFVVNVIDDWARQGLLDEAARHALHEKVEQTQIEVPPSLQQLIDRQIEQLSQEERRILESASIAGREFSVAAIAAGIETEDELVEEVCDTLARRGQFLRATEFTEWPDGTLTATYNFAHALYQEVLHERVPVGRRVRLHRQIGLRAEAGYGERTGEIAAELAVHFEHGRDIPRTIQYLQQAANTALSRSAYQEAQVLLSKASDLFSTLSDASERAQQELGLHLNLGRALTALKGYAAPEVGTAYTRSLELCRQLGETPQLFPVMFGLWQYSMLRSEFQTARQLGEQLLQLAERLQDTALRLESHRALGYTFLSLGEITAAHDHALQGVTLYDPQVHQSRAFQYGQDPGITCLVYAAQSLWLMGYPTQAVQRSQESLTLSETLAHPYSQAVTLGWAGWFHQLSGSTPAVQEHTEALLALSAEHGFGLWTAQGTILHGWSLAAQGQAEEGITELKEGLGAMQKTGTVLMHPYFLALLTEAYLSSGQLDEAGRALQEAFETAETTGERWYEAELHHLKGQLLRGRSAAGPNGTTAESCFQQAINVAQQQNAKAFELRASVSLSRLWQEEEKQHEAHQLLSGVYAGFTEGFDTPYLQEANALLTELA